MRRMRAALVLGLSLSSPIDSVLVDQLGFTARDTQSLARDRLGKKLAVKSLVRA